MRHITSPSHVSIVEAGTCNSAAIFPCILKTKQHKAPSSSKVKSYPSVLGSQDSLISLRGCQRLTNIASWNISFLPRDGWELGGNGVDCPCPLSASTLTENTEMGVALRAYIPKKLPENHLFQSNHSPLTKLVICSIDCVDLAH